MAVSLLITASPPALAASGDLGSVNATTMRACPDGRCAAARSIPATQVSVSCWRDGSGRWFRVTYGGTRGWVSAGAMYKQPSVPYCSDLLANEVLFAGQSVWSGNGSYRLVMQTDGNLVVYGPGGAIWSTRTTGTGTGNWAVMQSDGNFVVYTSANKPVYDTGTAGNVGTALVVQSDSNVVLYNGPALFATNWHTARGTVPSSVKANNAAWGWCTWYAYERFHIDSGIWPYFAGNAGKWNDSAAQQGWRVQSQPASHAIVVFEPTGSGSVGHVAWADGTQLRSDGWYVHIWEMNYDGSATVATGHVRERWLKTTPSMSYILSREL